MQVLSRDQNEGAAAQRAARRGDCTDDRLAIVHVRMRRWRQKVLPVARDGDRRAVRLHARSCAQPDASNRTLGVTADAAARADAESPAWQRPPRVDRHAAEYRGAVVTDSEPLVLSAVRCAPVANFERPELGLVACDASGAAASGSVVDGHGHEVHAVVCDGHAPRACAGAQPQPEAVTGPESPERAARAQLAIREGEAVRTVRDAQLERCLELRRAAVERLGRGDHVAPVDHAPLGCVESVTECAGALGVVLATTCQAQYGGRRPRRLPTRGAAQLAVRYIQIQRSRRLRRQRRHTAQQRVGAVRQCGHRPGAEAALQLRRTVGRRVVARSAKADAVERDDGAAGGRPCRRIYARDRRRQVVRVGEGRLQKVEVAAVERNVHRHRAALAYVTRIRVARRRRLADERQVGRTEARRRAEAVPVARAAERAHAVVPTIEAAAVDGDQDVADGGATRRLDVYRGGVDVLEGDGYAGFDTVQAH